jgi:hypothetical protein
MQYKQEVQEIIAASRPFKASEVLHRFKSSDGLQSSSRKSSSKILVTKANHGSHSQQMLRSVASFKGSAESSTANIMPGRKTHAPQRSLRGPILAKSGLIESHLPAITEGLPYAQSLTGDQLEQKAKLLIMKASGGLLMPTGGSTSGSREGYAHSPWFRPSQWTENKLGYSPSNPSLERNRNPEFFYQNPPSTRAKQILHKHQKVFAIQQLLYTTR